MFSWVNKTFSCCGKIFGRSNKKFICCPQFCCRSKTTFSVFVSYEDERPNTAKRRLIMTGLTIVKCLCASVRYRSVQLSLMALLGNSLPPRRYSNLWHGNF